MDKSIEHEGGNKRKQDTDGGGNEQKKKARQEEWLFTVWLSRPQEVCIVRLSSSLTEQQKIWYDECVRTGLFLSDLSSYPGNCGVLLRCDSGYRSIKTAACMFENRKRSMKKQIVFLNESWLKECYHTGVIYFDEDLHLNSTIYTFYDKIVARDWKSNMTTTCVCVHVDIFDGNSEFHTLLSTIFDWGTTIGDYYVYNTGMLPFVTTLKDGLKELSELMGGVAINHITKADEAIRNEYKGNSVIKRMGVKQFVKALLDSFE